METLLRKYPWAIDLAVVALCSIFVARATATLLERTIASKAPVREAAPRVAAVERRDAAKNEIGDILERNVFCSGCGPLSGEAPPKDTAPVAPRKTALPLALLAIMYAPRDARWSMAIIRDTETRTSGAFALGGRIGDAIVIDIGATRVALLVAGRQEYLELVERGPGPAPTTTAATRTTIDGGIRKTGEHSYEVRRATVDALLGDMGALALTVRVVPVVEAGRPAGFRLLGLRTDGPLAKLGFQSGDLLRAVNGLELTSPQRALEAFAKLQSASHLSVALVHNGRRLTNDYDIR